MTRATTRGATAFEKAVQNNPFGSREHSVQPFDKSKFEQNTKAPFRELFILYCYF
jgi:hypothetical protein